MANEFPGELLLEAVEKITALDAEYREGKRNAKDVARSTVARLDSLAAKVDAIDQRTSRDSTTLQQVLAQQRITNGRVNSHDLEIDALERDRAVREAVAKSRSWRFPALVTVVLSVTSGVVVALLTLTLR